MLTIGMTLTTVPMVVHLHSSLPLHCAVPQRWLVRLPVFRLNQCVPIGGFEACRAISMWEYGPCTELRPRRSTSCDGNGHWLLAVLDVPAILIWLLHAQ